MTKNILLTGYEPFDRFEYNPSQEIARALNGRLTGAGYQVYSEVLPVDCEVMPSRLAQLWQKYQPVLILGLGLAAGETCIRVETIGHNWVEITGKPDNGGHHRAGEQLHPDGAAAYFSSFRAEDVVQKLLAAGIPAYKSPHAGAHLCNQFLYEALYQAARMDNRETPRIGFIHLPGTPQMLAAQLHSDRTSSRFPTMSLELMQQAVELALEVA